MVKYERSDEQCFNCKAHAIRRATVNGAMQIFCGRCKRIQPQEQTK